MPELPTPTKEAFKAIKTYLQAQVASIANSGKVINRLRYADNVADWLKIAAVEKTGKKDFILRAVFIYLADFQTAKVEGRKSLVTAIYSLEVLQGFYDGTDGDNSTLTYESLLGDLIDYFHGDENLSFSALGTDLTHTGLQGGEGDGRPENVDGVLAHRKILTLTVSFKIC